MLSLLLLKAEPGYPDPDALGLIGFCWFLMLGCWAIGYAIGSRKKAALLGAALGCLAAMPILAGGFIAWDLSFFVVLFLIALQIWGGCAVGYAIGKRFQHALAGGWWGGFLSLISLIIFGVQFFHPAGQHL
jgi:hypothetical protein